MPQVRNDQLVASLAGEFQRRYEPQFAWENAIAIHQLLPGLRGFWPMSSITETGTAHDLSTQARHLTYSGNPSYNNRDFAPYIDLDGVGDMLYRTDEAGLDITGTEAHVIVANRGITLGCWVNVDALNAGADQFIMSKAVSTAAAGMSYAIYIRSNTLTFTSIFSNGVALESQVSATFTVATWYHVVGRWSPTGSGVERSIFVDGLESSAASALAALNNTNANFRIGARDTGAGGGAVTDPMAGLISFAFLCAYALPDVIIQSIWQQTRAMFNK